jgi:xylose isomerase
MMSMTNRDSLTPTPEHRFTFGLWTVGNPAVIRSAMRYARPLRRRGSFRNSSELGAYGVNLHDEDLIPRDATAAEHDRIVREFKAALSATGMKVPMATTNLFSDPAFRDGAFTSNDARVRRYALQKTMHAMDLGIELGRRDVRVLGWS